MTFFGHLMRSAAMQRPATSNIPILRLIRYALSGALAGVAVAGILAWAMGAPQRDFHDLVGAGLGFAAVILIKAMHVV